MDSSKSTRSLDFDFRLVLVWWSLEESEDSLASLPGLVSHCTVPSRRSKSIGGLD